MIARVLLDLALRREFDYLVPEEFRDVIGVGSRVKVPFGRRDVMGSVVDLPAASPHTNLRALTKVVGKQALITPRVLDLARWIAGYYCCPVETALRSVLPDSVRQEEEGWRERLHVRLLPSQGAPPKLTPRQQDILRVVEEWRELPFQELLRLTGATPDTVRRLEDKGLIAIAAEVSERDPYANEVILPTQPLALNDEQARALGEITRALEATHATLAPASGGPPPASRRRHEGTGTGQSSATTAGDPASAGPAEVSGDRPLPAPAGPPVAGATAAGAGTTSSASIFLLHGVTGSGKTEVYLQAIAHTLAQGRGAIVLVPEISLTPQTVERFKARFSSGPLRTLVAVLHSHLSAGERHDEWQKVRQGRARIVIGARSAIFAPVEPLGLIIVDEEHEHSYKQEEAPRYHARDVSVMRGQREGAVVVLGSATPSMESYHNAKRGKYVLLELLKRVDDQRMPVVRVVDLRMESRKQKGPPVFSQQLKDAIRLRLDRREQTMLFLNRRGFATSMLCPQCGHVAGCPNCSVALTYHRQRQKLCCHICGHEEPAPVKCPAPKCGSPAIRYSGLGTEKVEDTLRKLFPKAEIRRMDSDTLKRKDDFRRILGDFRTGKIDILVGTQMIAKGLHFPNVTLVGIVYADLGLHLPDFRAGERTFQLLTQVAGRAGRGDVEGEVFVQAFTPFHPAIQYARRHDFTGFYDQEIEFREQLKYPPVARVALLTLKGRNEDKVKFTAEHLRKALEPLAQEFPDLILAGPAPAPLLRAETYYRHQLMLRARQMSRLSARLAELLGNFTPPEDVTMTVDVDPVDLM
ncbi:MAG: primosomal protein N' [Limisphaerales bacterium]